MNGVCGASRLLGVYHLWPQIIPIPSTESVELRVEDEYVVLATHSLWKYVTYEQAVHEARSISDPIPAAKRLRDLAVAHGCHADVSVVVVKLKMDRDPVPPTRSLHELQPLEAILQPELDVEEEEEEEEEEDEEEEFGVTNIDDAMSDNDDIIPPTSAPPLDSTAQDDMDRMVLNAIGTPLTPEETDQPMMQSTNFDDLPLSDDSPQTSTPLAMDSVPSDFQDKTQGRDGDSKQLSRAPHQLLQQQQMEYEAQTLPKIASQARKSSGFSDLETSSFEQTQVGSCVLCIRYMYYVGGMKGVGRDGREVKCMYCACRKGRGRKGWIQTSCNS